ncbi:MAG TPA: cytochrome c biogenesis protein ResB [Planctomycetota bacterium]|nr:cytochrome c biogenesis protein ResB [Planctomycetota bacterium]
MPRKNAFRGVIRFLGSLWFLVTLLVLMLIALILPTIINQLFNPDLGYDRTVGALRRDWYGAWWFNILMFLLMVNLTVCTVIRTPWRHFWMWGFLITHSGILTLMIGAAVTFNTKIYGDLQALEGGSYDYFTIENENELAVRTSHGDQDAFQLRMNPYRRSTERKSFKLKDSSVFIHVDEFVPNVTVDPTYRESASGGEPIAEIAVHPPEQEPKKRSIRLDSPIHFGPLAIVAKAMSDTDYAAISEAPPDRPTLTVTIAGETRDLDVESQAGQAVRVGDATVTIRKSGAPNRQIPDHWVEFEVSRAGRKEETWFALTLEAISPHAGDSDVQARFRLRWTPDSVHEGAMGALYFCKTPSGLRRLWISSKGERNSAVLAPESRLSNPFMPMPLQVELVRWLDRAEETAEETEPRRNRPRNPALKVTAVSGAHQQTRWVKFFGDPVIFDLVETQAQVIFRGRAYRDLPFTLGLDDFRVTFNKGTNAPKHFESDLTLTDHETGEVSKQTIEVNTPMKYKGFVIYQASWNPDDPRMSIFQISKDPGKKVLYLGWVMAVSGSMFMFFLKPFLQKLIKAGSKGGDAPLGSGAALGVFALVTLGTVVGLVAPLVFPGVSPLWLGLGVAGADLVLALTVAIIAKAWIAFKPVRAMQTGEILAAGWCLNTAALVILLMMKVTA